MLTIDGSRGEGGGQVLRSALALSLITGEPFRIGKIRAGRKKPGLMRQHMASVKAAAAIGQAELGPLELGSAELEFCPKEVVPGEYCFSIGTAGSTCLVLQTVLPPLLTASGPSRLTLEGGTHADFAPTYDFFVRVFAPLLGRMGAKLRCEFERPGFYPKGGGRFHVAIDPVETLAPIELLTRGEVVSRKATALVAGIPRKVADRELSTVQWKLDWEPHELEVIEHKREYGPGNALLLEVESQEITELFSGIGERGVRAEEIAKRAAGRVLQYLESRAPVGRYLADQLMIPLAMAGGGCFETTELSQHSKTNIEVVERFLPVRFKCEAKGETEVRIEILPRK